MSALRLGLVGCGRLAEIGYVPAVARAPGVEIVAVADLSRSRRTPLLLATAVEGAAVMCVLGAARRSDAVGGDATPVEGDRSRQPAAR